MLYKNITSPLVNFEVRSFLSFLINKLEYYNWSIFHMYLYVQKLFYNNLYIYNTYFFICTFRFLFFDFALFCLLQELLFNFTDLSDSSFYCTLLPIYNADTDKQKIIKENKGKSGIYMWMNLINGKRYVGSSDNL
jgi:hypothetical protein